MSDDGGAKPLWSGRFSKPPAAEAWALGRSLGFDLELIAEDIEASRAHVKVLQAAGLLDADQGKLLAEALDRVPELILSRAEDAEDAADAFSDAEDVHTLVEHLVTEQLGDLGAGLHAGCSRNDLVVTDLRLWCLSAATDIAENLEGLAAALAGRARESADLVMPGFTHNRPAQVVTAGYVLAAHAFAILRDLDRFDCWFERSAVSPLGAGALATSTLGLDPKLAAREFGLPRTFDNALDATADRDFVLEFLSAASIAAMHISRLAADLARWSEPSLGYAVIDEGYSTGSSMMPQKRNPDIAELARGKAARVAGDLVTVTMLLSGLPLGYHRDLQEDKRPAFDAAATLLLVLPAVTGMVATLAFSSDSMRRDAESEDLFATDVAEALVKDGVPFREAHRRVGKLLKSLDEEKRTLRDLGVDDWEAFGLPSGADMLDPDASVRARNMPGGTAPERVLEQVAAIEAALASRV